MNKDERSLINYRVHHARFLKLFGSLSLDQLILRRDEAVRQFKATGLTDELRAKQDVLARLIHQKEMIRKNPNYDALRQACDGFEEFAKSITTLRREVMKAFRKIRKVQRALEQEIEAK